MSVGWLVHHNFLKVREITLIILLFLALVIIYNILISSLSTGCSKTNSTVPREYFCELVFLMFFCHNINFLLFSFMCWGISSTKLFPLYVNFFSKTTPPFTPFLTSFPTTSETPASESRVCRGHSCFLTTFVLV